jgi:hypothetical protein
MCYLYIQMKRVRWGEGWGDGQFEDASVSLPPTGLQVAGWLNFLAYAGLPSNVRWAFDNSVQWMYATTNSTLDPGNLWAYSQPGPVPASSPAWSGANLIFGNLVRG